MWSPQVGPQLDAILATWCPELFYGGARGGGKSDYLLGDFLQDVPTYGRLWRGIIFRRTYDELEELQARAEEIFPETGAIYRAVKRTWYWPNGAFLKMRYMEKEKDYNRYHGHQYAWIGWDELTAWPSDAPYKKLISCLRVAQGHVPTKRIRSSGNPGGVGHTWVKNRFVKPNPLGFKSIRDEELKWDRMFVPAKVRDNKKLLQNDPEYINRLKGSGPPELVRCWLDGDWDAIVGAFFHMFRAKQPPKGHVLPYFEIPPNWLRFRSVDWGYARPFSVGWWAVSNGEQPQGLGWWIPPGALVRYREWYGAKGPNEGLKLNPADVAKGIVERTKGEKILYTVADPSMFKVETGECIAETFSKNGVTLKRGENNRVNGWQQLVTRMDGIEVLPEVRVPMLYFQEQCINAIELIPAAQHDPDKPEDVDTEGEDHLPDECRYAAMSRPWYRSPEQTERGRTLGKGLTLNDMWASQEQEKAKRRQW